MPSAPGQGAWTARSCTRPPGKHRIDRGHAAESEPVYLDDYLALAEAGFKRELTEDLLPKHAGLCVALRKGAGAYGAEGQCSTNPSVGVSG
jgi:hypothetical protein